MMLVYLWNSVFLLIQPKILSLEAYLGLSNIKAYTAE